MITLVYSPKQHLPKDMQHSVFLTCELELTCFVEGPRAEFKATLVLNHQT